MIAHTVEELYNLSTEELQRVGRDSNQRTEMCRELEAFPCVCGEILEKDRTYDIECSDCGREYNCFGQMLAPREQWEESDEDDY